MNNTATAAQLRAAANVTDQVAASGGKVLTFYSNGRQPVLFVDQPPAGVNGALCRRQPDGNGGVQRILAAPLDGVQLEWVEKVEPSMPELAHVR
jgi:hypothetical protein